MAEILISLTIIGVIAAITLPALQANINESTWRTQRKALYSRMSQAIAMMPSLNGYGEFVAPDENGENGKDTVAMSFVTNGLGKVLELKNICDYENLGKCGIPDKIKNLKGDIIVKTSDITTFDKTTADFAEYLFPATHAAAFETKNGESLITYVNPTCKYDTLYTNRGVCVNFIYDLNGRKGPNKIGSDVGFITAVYPTDSEVVAPLPTKYGGTGNHHYALSACKQYGSDTKLPTNYELMSLYANNVFRNVSLGGLWTNSLAVNGQYYNMATRYGTFSLVDNIDLISDYHCIKR